MSEELPKTYNAGEVEGKIYRHWEESGFFNPDNLPGKREESFSIILPPPNVTGILHMGSALMLAVEDILIRYARMRGKRALWVPGTDSAAIATQTKVEKEIQKKEGKNRHDLGREELLKRIDKFIEENKTTILTQIRAMGASVDWSRYAYTMDNARYRAVMTAFIRMYEEGLIYRGNRIVNWDPKGQTTISDDEIVYEERKAKFYTFRYTKDFPISISTTRPETKVGDTAVAVHPDDPRYKEYVGKEYDLEFVGVPLHIKIIADKSVDPEFGTGALGVTPAHSMIDWEIAERHGLPVKQVINEYARMTVGGDNLLDKKVAEAREFIVQWLEDNNLLEKTEEITQNISTAERTGGIIEPLPKLQWFVNVNKEIPGRGKTLKDIMRDPVANNEIRIIPNHSTKTYFHWIDNLRDWCISRQIWFGHRIPIWYRGEEIKCGLEKPEGEGWEQDPDVLDTWFSSALWTFSTLGWPDETPDLLSYHPTTVLETGYDILFFWVARMIMMSGLHLKQIPFKTVYLHGLVRDEQGRKISKSLGNNLDPLEMIAKYGADSVRMSLIIGTAAGTDSKISEPKIKGYRNFSTKLWNISRFVLMSIPDPIELEKISLVPEDQKLLDELSIIAKDITKDMEEFRFYLAGEKIYHYIWHTFADKIIEESKTKLASENPDIKTSAQRMLLEILITCLKLLHPFMPFVTEEIYSKLPITNKKLLMIETWPSIL
ncbi:MAG: valine--tRNA ligase [Candidatus Yanofskybacteria bacterium RIFCSPHIGHO2_01_FULL_41_21]|uniref:Valine--tRNA ligase n=1 Tax=Candidatus Yanofskybacteria bacterium RIFCSPHIGHO2_01_FULL_41_21 TaxID=1802660 RepID=A0A1F8EC15_9BACT|nr:MAG: valine--tRNA ligase [Candidatus Yanofskybacteria bacterium RIFCSPHIGHO2_01_FULL_41_21]